MAYEKKFAWKLLFVVGIILASMGIHFIFFRPAFLPEDIEFLKIEGRNDLIKIMAPWLKYVFTVLGGYVFATGIFMIDRAVADSKKLEVRWN